MNKILYYLIKFYQKYIFTKVEKIKSDLIIDSVKNKGQNCHIKMNSKIYYRDRLVLGDYVNIGENAHLFCMGGLKIGTNTQISRNVVIYTANHNIESNCIPYDKSYIKKTVVIGKSVWIGMNVMITPGVNIGDGAVIGMGTVVSKDVPAGAIVVGSQQRIINYRKMDEFKQKEQKKYFYGLKYE